MNLESSRMEKARKILLIFVPIIYATALSFSITDSLFWADDGYSLAFVRNVSSIWSLFHGDAFLFFRPVKNFIWLVFSWLAQFGVEWCHVVAIAVGVLSFYPVHALCCRVFGSKWKGLAASSIWILSPTLVSQTAWLSGVNIQVMSAFVCLSFVFHDKAWDHNSFHAGLILPSGLFLLLALVTYECAIAEIPLLFLFDVLLRNDRIRHRNCQCAHVFYWTLTVLYLVLRHSACIGVTATEGRWVEASRWQLIASSPYFTVQHFASWFWPFTRFAVLGNYKWGTVSTWTLCVCWILVLAVLGVSAFSRKRAPILSFCILFAFIGFAPTSNCLGFGNGPYGDYYLSLASIGLAAGCVEASFLLLRATGSFRLFALTIVGGFVVLRLAMIVETGRWSWLWGSGERAFQRSIECFPSFFANKISFVEFLSDEGRHEEALELAQQVETAIGSDSPRMTPIHLVRALYAIKVTHDENTALSLLDQCEKNPDFNIDADICHFYRGCVYEDLRNDVDAAKQEYEAALANRWTFELIPCVDRLARLKALQGSRDEAISLWERASKIDDENVTVLWNLSTAYREAGEMEKSEEAWRRVQKLTGKGK